MSTTLDMPIQSLPASMKAALFYEPGMVRYENMPLPPLGPGEILVKIGAALTCGTDLKCYRRGHPVLLKTFPSPFGHEFAGTVAAVDGTVTTFKPGDRVVAANSAPCGECFYCERQRYNLCEHLDLLNGAYADYLKVPARIVAKNTYRLPDHLSFEAAAFCEPLAVSLRGVELSGIRPGDRVAILGLGPIGQLLVKAAKLKGAHVTAFGRNPLKRRMAVEFGGADTVAALHKMPEESIRASYTPEGRGFDVVIEAIGQPATWELAVRLVRRGGLVNLFGGCPSGSQIQLDTRRLHYDEITLISLFHHTPEFFKMALDWIATGTLDPTLLITRRMPMSQVPAALETVEAGKAIKIALTPDEAMNI